MQHVLTIVFMFLAVSAYSQKCHIYGHAPEYAGQTIVFERYKDFISEETETVFRIQFNAEGDFDEEFETCCIQPVFSEFGVFKAHFYAIPGGKLELKFPTFIEKTDAEGFNPYFKPVQFHLGVISGKTKGLNAQIIRFDNLYEDYLNTNSLEIFNKGFNEDVEAFISGLDSIFGEVREPYFKDYMQYRIATLRHFAGIKIPEVITYEYFTKNDVLYYNPAYMELANRLFKNLLDKKISTEQKERLIQAVSYAKSPYEISKVFASDFELENMELRYLAILKGLHDAYLNDTFNAEKLDLCLDSLAHHSPYPEQRIIAGNILEKMQHLREGQALPEDLCLSDLDGNSYCLSDFRNSYLYFGFHHSKLIPCQRQTPVLKKIAKSHSSALQVISIFFDSNPEDVRRFKDLHGIKWPVLIAEDKESLKESFEIHALPTYYLLDPSGKLIYAPAPAPTEHFEERFIEILR